MIVRIDRDNPRIKITMRWETNPPQGEIALYMRRAGEPEFAVYAPIDVRGGELTFQFDELLFVQRQGRYYGRLVIGSTNYGTLDFEYRDVTRIVSMENDNV